jgi:ArsR family transcriptional regulator
MTRDSHPAKLVRVPAHPALRRKARPLRALPGCIGGDVVEAVRPTQGRVPGPVRTFEPAGIMSGGSDGLRFRHARPPGAPGPMARFTAALSPPPGDARRVRNRGQAA